MTQREEKHYALCTETSSRESRGDVPKRRPSSSSFRITFLSSCNHYSHIFLKHNHVDPDTVNQSASCATTYANTNYDRDVFPIVPFCHSPVDIDRVLGCLTAPYIICDDWPEA